MQFDNLIETLYSRHYFNGPASLKFSQETSSHWREFGKKTNVIMVKKPGEVIDYEIKAYGISGFKKNTLLNRLINIPSSYLLPKILSQYNANPETTRCAIGISKKLNIIFNFDHVKHILICLFIFSSHICNMYVIYVSYICHIYSHVCQM